ncbi:hypothetical protein PROFUN_05498 [Planoprotostelium fungivorum]|uniref:JmjC domain-containing protein n=1 Tax=Planoprotostelium fungivorum TaxID=1890364 RepID=A0A2P6NQX3_9EUKA|nr:hypothetical protein PROFUN_05498 [Planoprotostelium fungivorum]
MPEPSVRTEGLGSLSMFTDELILARIFSRLSAKDLISSVPLVSKVFYVFSNEEFLWKSLALDRHGGDFLFQGNWKLTALTPKERQTADPNAFPTMPTRVPVQGFTSHALYYRWYLSHLPLKEFHVDHGHVPRIDIKTIDLEDFRENYDAPCKIVMLKGAMDGWKAHEHWKGEEMLKRYGDIQWKVSHKGKQKLTMNLKNYMHYAKLQSDEAPLYIFDSDFGEKAPEMLKDYTPPSLFREDMYELLEENRPNFRWVILGPERSGSPWHTDPDGTSAWNSLLSGRKRWAFYPPHIVPPGLTLHPNGRGLYTDMEAPFPVEWFYAIYPSLLPHQRPIEEAGETIFVPRGWWHIVLNLEDTVAVTQNFVGRCNVRDTLEEIATSKKRDKDFEHFVQVLTAEHPEYTQMTKHVRREREERRQEKLKEEGGADDDDDDETDLWEALRAVCAHHGMEVPQEKYQVELPSDSTNTVFMTEKAVVKFYTAEKEARESFDREVNMYSLLQGSEVKCPKLLFSGQIVEQEEGYHLTNANESIEGGLLYVVASRLLGDPVRDVWSTLQNESIERSVDFLAENLRKLHDLKRKVSDEDVEHWKKFITKRDEDLIKDHESWFITDSTVISQMRDYIDVDRQILDAPNRFQLIHSDVNDENLIGYYPGQLPEAKLDTTKRGEGYLKEVYDWQPSGLIDFGDACVGDPMYDLVALHVSLFRCDKKLLRRFLETYGVDRWPLMREPGRFSRTMMMYTLLHQCNAMATVYRWKPHLIRVTDLRELEKILWDLSV